jgi:hypothetical protein
MRLLAVAGLVWLLAASPAALQRGVRTVTDLICMAPLGGGVKSERVFCDVLIGAEPNDSVAVTIPPYTGTATLQFDLHNRFTVPAILIPGPLTFARHEAVVSIIRPNGAVIARAAVLREFRDLTDLFDQIGGGSNPGGVKAVAPGPPESVRVTVPAGLSAVGIIGARLAVMTRTSQEVFDTPGRPVAIVSNVRLQYRPR